MENVGHINRSEGLTSSYKYDEWVGGEFKDITTQTHTHTLSTQSPLKLRRRTTETYRTGPCRYYSCLVFFILMF